MKPFQILLILCIAFACHCEERPRSGCDEAISMTALAMTHTLRRVREAESDPAQAEVERRARKLMRWAELKLKQEAREPSQMLTDDEQAEFTYGARPVWMETFGCDEYIWIWKEKDRIWMDDKAKGEEIFGQLDAICLEVMLAQAGITNPDDKSEFWAMTSFEGETGDNMDRKRELQDEYVTKIKDNDEHRKYLLEQFVKTSSDLIEALHSRTDGMRIHGNSFLLSMAFRYLSYFPERKQAYTSYRNSCKIKHRLSDKWSISDIAERIKLEVQLEVEMGDPSDAFTFQDWAHALAQVAHEHPEHADACREIADALEAEGVLEVFQRTLASLELKTADPGEFAGASSL